MNVYYTSWVAWEHSGIPLEKLGRVPEEREKAVGISHTHIKLWMGPSWNWDRLHLLRSIVSGKIISITRIGAPGDYDGAETQWDMIKGEMEGNLTCQIKRETTLKEQNIVSVLKWKGEKKEFVLGFTYWTAPLFQSGNNVLFM